METNDLQIEDLKTKIEKYRQAVTSLKTHKHDEDSQMEKRMKSLEEQLDQMRTHQKELDEQIKVMQTFMDEVKEGKVESVNEEPNQAEDERKRRYQQSDLKTIPSFNSLKKLANQIPVLYTNSHPSSQKDSPPNRTMNKKYQYKALPSIEGQQIGYSGVQNEADQMNVRLDPIQVEQMEDAPAVKESIQAEPIEEVNEGTEKAMNRAAGFWKGILKG